MSKKIKLLLLADPSSPHTVRWANALRQKGFQIYLFGLSDYDSKEYHPEIQIKTLKTPEWIKIRYKGNFLKLIYIFELPKLKKIIREYNPDIIHAHYVASYGILGALTNFHPFFISVWGIDIFLFPTISIIHRALVKFALKKADKIFSTSQIMAQETAKYSSKDIEVIPFGVDPEIFTPTDTEGKDSGVITIGLVKSLERKYGIEKLIIAFELLKSRNPGLNLRLMLIGGGSLEAKFRQMVKSKGLEKETVFTGSIPHQEIANYHRKLDIAVYLSTTESFGVSVIESSACGKPVVVSDVGGLPEVVENNKTGIIIPDGDPYKACLAMESLIKDEKLRTEMGNLGRQKVIENYSWKENVNQMLQNYIEQLT